ncbi:hypothetical protein [Paenibacillus sp. GP183]|uniref:hypothetical protein n=1 Tax=Paenibacillus sp. GP183 TaxID=1882751 RepID=UPI000895652F|nr:hypothetical protein [Paenibacillus sp. GP183]SED14758.1 hypothetical protein SAMN05443246_5903 [Paenibacillus sp. GP183]
MRTSEETIISSFIFIVAVLGLFLPVHVFILCALVSICLAAYRLYQLFAIESPTASVSSFMFAALVCAMAALLWKYTNLREGLLLFGGYWLLRGAYVEYFKILRSRLNRLYYSENFQKPRIDVTATDENEALKQVVFQMGQHLQQIANQIGAVSSAVNSRPSEITPAISNLSAIEQELLSIREIETQNKEDLHIIKNKYDEKFQQLQNLMITIQQENQARNQILDHTVKKLFSIIEDTKRERELTKDLFTPEKLSGQEVQEELENQFRFKYQGFFEDSIKSVALAHRLEKDFQNEPVSHSLYGVLTILYTGIMEQELRAIIAFNEGRTEIPERLWYRICDYLNRNRISGLIYPMPDFVKKLKLIKKIRNLAAHGAAVTRTDYELVKKFALIDDAFYLMSETKISLKQTVVLQTG